MRLSVKRLNAPGESGQHFLPRRCDDRMRYHCVILVFTVNVLPILVGGNGQPSEGVQPIRSGRELNTIVTCCAPRIQVEDEREPQVSCWT